MTVVRVMEHFKNEALKTLILEVGNFNQQCVFKQITYTSSISIDAKKYVTYMLFHGEAITTC